MYAAAGNPRRLLLIATMAVTAGCANGLQGERDLPAALAYETRSHEETLRDCPEHLDPCAAISITYPRITSAPSNAARAAIQAFIDASILAPVDEGEETGDVDALMTRFLDGYRDFSAAYPEVSTQWSMTRSVRVLHNADGVFSLEAAEESYTGGAHPNGVVRLASFDAQTGRRLRLDDVLVDGHEARLREAGERAFRAARQLSASDDLTAAGFWFDDGRFELNDNFALTAGGLRFYYNRYEIAPYALDVTEMLIPASALADLAKPGSPLATRAPTGG